MRALQYAAAMQTTVNMSLQAQQAARAAAAALNPTVPNGLVFGGLDPVANPLPAAQDPTGLQTWEGANAPTQTTTSSGVQVTITQTQSRAVLDWQTFNVGAKTTLTFDQAQNGIAQPDWVVLNRVVGQLNPLTGLRDPNLAPAPSQIFGSITAPGTVLILNQNGVLFGATAQVNTNSLIATSLEIGRALDDNGVPLNIAERDQEFLSYGLLGVAEEVPVADQSSAFTFSAQAISSTQYDPMLEGTIDVEAGAQITSGDQGYILLTGPKVINSGELNSSDGQVSLQAGREITVTPSNGTATAVDPNVRGFVVSSLDRTDAAGSYVENTAIGIIESPRGYLSLGATSNGAVINDGVLSATTSVSRNGYIQLSGGDIELGSTSLLTITPDPTDETIPQGSTAATDFQTSRIDIGNSQSRIEIDSNSLIYAPSANILIGSDPGPTTVQDILTPGTSRIFIGSGAVIDAAGLTDVLVSGSTNSIEISPVTGNDLANDPNYQNTFLDGATIYVDPRLSGVTSNGIAWIGSPLVTAASYYQQVGVSAAQLMTAGGNVTLGTQSFTPRADTSQAPDVIVKAGAVIDISGGWVEYQAGMVQTTDLISASGNIVNIGDANPNDAYVGIFNGYTTSQPTWGVSQTWASPLLQGAIYEGAYTEGRDAGSLTIQSSVVVLDGTVYANAYPGPLQLLDAEVGTGTSSVYGDLRAVQAVPSQLPVGGFLFIQALGQDDSGIITGGGDISIVSGSNFQPVPSSLQYGQSVYIDANGNLVVPVRNPASVLPAQWQDTITLSASALSQMGLSQISLETSGQITDAAQTTVNLNPGGVFTAFAGRTITIDGTISAPSGKINLETTDVGMGSVLVPTQAELGSFDVVVNGSLSTSGLWVNDYGATAANLVGDAYTNGGSISLTAAPRVTLYSQVATVADTLAGNAPDTNVDISGSILLNSGSLINVSGGGYVEPNGSFNLSAKGGNLTLTDQTTYFQLADDPNLNPGGIPGFRVTTTLNPEGTAYVPVNPSQINSSVSLDGTILADGFGGGGTFTLTTPEFSFGAGTAFTGTELPMTFFSTAGFANYNITSYKTDLLQNTFDNGLGGYNAVLATQDLIVGAGQTLLLSQSYFSPLLTGAQISTLRALHTGGDLYSVLTPGIPTDAWDQKAVNLTLGGSLELDVAPGGEVLGAAGGSLTVSGLLNEGTIRIPGGTIDQTQLLPAVDTGSNALAIANLSQAFATNADGSIDENAPNALGIQNPSLPGTLLTNAQLASQYSIYVLGGLAAGEGIHLAPSSVTNLAGESIVDPRATAVGPNNPTQINDGIVVAGGTLETAPSRVTSTALFQTSLGTSVYDTEISFGVVADDLLNAAPGAIVNLSGASTTFTQLAQGGFYAPTKVWSDGGTLSLGNGGTVSGADIAARGGAPEALGGELVVLDPVLYQNNPAAPVQNAISAQMIGNAGFATFVAEGSVDTSGNVDLKLGRGFFVVSRPYGGQDLGDTAVLDTFAPVISTTGNLTVDAPYILLGSQIQSVSNPQIGTPGSGRVTLTADDIDIQGAVLFDESVANVDLNSSGDVRLIGVEPWQQTYNIGADTVNNSLGGQLLVNGNLQITAGQIYPTTGSTFLVASASRSGAIEFLRASDSTPATPYSAGGNLTVQAAHIIQNGVVRVPLGSLTLGSDSELDITTDGVSETFAPRTLTLDAGNGSITSVSADGLTIPYGTTTDQTEWYFAPTSENQLTAPPAGVLTMSGKSIDLQTGANVDLSGGGDVYAYEFIPGPGGSLDVLSQLNPDPFTSNNGYQYPDGRQIYAIVPGLSQSTVAAYDPIYSAGYGSLYSASSAGMQVYLSAAPGLAAGWYTLLPAQYATLPGGMRVVADTNAGPAVPGASGTLADGTDVVSGYYGVAGTGAYQSTELTFDVQSQSVFTKYSDIALTYGNTTFAALAQHDDVVTPPLPIDADRLILNPEADLTIDSTNDTTPAEGGRGAEVDISGDAFDIVSTQSTDPAPAGTIVLTAGTLDSLNAASLLIGGIRTDNADGTTSLDVTAQSIMVENNSENPLSGPEIVLVVGGANSQIVLGEGSSIVATGNDDSTLTGDYIIDGAVLGPNASGAMVRVSTGPQRFVERENITKPVPSDLLVNDGATLQGNAVLLDSSGDSTIGSAADIKADALALDASTVSFAPTAGDASGLVITPGLQALISQADTLNINASNAIAFSSGNYKFGNVTFDAPSLSSLDGGSVVIQAGDLSLQNSGTDAGACGTGTAGACGNGVLSIDASEITFGSGTVRTYGFGQGVSFASSGGIFYDGTGAIDVGPANLAIDTPFIGDQAITLAAGVSAVVPSLQVSTSGNLSIVNSTSAAAPAADGTPGADLSLTANDISISGATLRATAGTLNVTSATDISVTGGALLETPGYSRTFGDSADPVQISAPGGLLILNAQTGNIDIASGTTVSVGGGIGNAGALEFVAGNGTVTLDGTLDANAPGGGGAFSIDTAGAFDLSSFAAGAGQQFTGGIQISTGTGDLVLASGNTLRSSSVTLDADGGAVTVGGTINTSGTNGGDINLYGANGVTLQQGALLDADATGYASDDTRQATGGTVEIGTSGVSAITVAQGATIDVSALRPGDRMVPTVNDGVTYYTYVEGDQGGVVHFRAPVIQTASGESVNIFVGGTVTGASSIVVEGFQQYNLATVADDPKFVGVTINSQGQAVLDTAATGSGGAVNFLADNAPGTVVNFVQNFNISSAYGQFGGLASLPQFHAQPGIELDYSGDIVLQSNWNLGAGVVNVAGAVQAGLMAPVPNDPGAYYVLPGDDAQVFSQFTSMTYRTGGAVNGEPGILTLRAGGNLDIEGSITDGFFTFRDQTDPQYLDQALGGGDQVYTPYLSPDCSGTCATIGSWQAGSLPGDYVSISLPGNGQLQGILNNPIPYDAAANTPAALGSGANGSGDPIGSAELFPLLGTAQTVVNSWSYNLVGGADLASADPMRVDPASGGSVIVAGQTSYTFSGTPGSTSFDNSLLMQAGNGFSPASQWLQTFLAENPTLNANSYTDIDFSSAPAAALNALTAQARQFFSGYSGQYQFTKSRGAITGVTTSVALAAEFFSSTNFGAIASGYKPPKTPIITKPTTVTVPTLVRTGTGNIAVAAASDINLQNGDTVYRTLDGKTGTLKNGGVQVGGTSIYTAGHLVDPAVQVITDILTGTTWTIDPGDYASTGDVFNTPLLSGYRYGAGGTPDVAGAGYNGVLIANPVYAEGGGNITLNAGGNVLGRGNVWQAALIDTYYDITSSYGYSWIGNGDQPWRSGAVGNITNIQVDPQLFQGGVGTLGGGSITVTAGSDVSDLTAVATTSVVTANVVAAAGDVSPTQALWSFGGGNVSVTADGDILGGRVDVASGAGSIVAYGNIGADGAIVTEPFATPTPDELWVRLSDAVVAIDAGQGAQIEGITALGVRGTSSNVQQDLDSFGFYSPDAGVSIVANGAVGVENNGADVVTTSNTSSTDYTSSAVYPGSFEAVSMTGNIDLATQANTQNQAAEVLMMPSPTGELGLYAAANIDPVTLAMEDADPGLLPGVFSIFGANSTEGVTSGLTFIFPAVLPDTTQVELEQMHNQNITHAGDSQPNYLYAGGDIDDVILSVPKQTRVTAGLDIVNMMFFGQNVSASDITRIVAGRDITATTELVNPVIGLPYVLGQPLAAVQGNTFVVGGPGSFFLEAGRDAGPFLNSAVTDGFANSAGLTVSDGVQTYGGGILSVGNNWNPWLPQQGADLYVEFGVANGANYNGFRDYYLDPANLANLPGSLFVQVKDAAGNLVPDRSDPIYGPILIGWMQTHESEQLLTAYGTTNVTFQQAYNVFVTLPELVQRVFLIGSVYFNELEQPSIPTSPSYQQYSRGYTAVNLLFPASLGYTQNNLGGGGNGANQTVETGNLDLRLATIQTEWGGNIYILGPGGEVLAGSTVATSAQAARRAYIGGELFSGLVPDAPLPSAITSIPAGYEGILTLRGGSIDTFTDDDFLINQSRLFTEDGGDIVMWSSNGSLNAGQGPKTSVDFPPVVVQTDEDMLTEVDSVGGVTGAGIAAFEPAAGVVAPNVYLLAPRGTVNAGDAGVRVAGNLFIAAFSVVNAANFSVGGTAVGIPTAHTIDVGVQTSAGAATAAVAESAQNAVSSRQANTAPSIITVDVLGYYGDTSSDEDEKKKRLLKAK
jgi:filamentous hemagglutinin family protein